MTVSSLVLGYPSRALCQSGLPMSEGARNGEPACLHGLEKSHALREEGTMMVLPVDVSVRVGRHMPARVLARMAHRHPSGAAASARGAPRQGGHRSISELPVSFRRGCQ
jgi:hypothetical protein